MTIFSQRISLLIRVHYGNMVGIRMVADQKPALGRSEQILASVRSKTAYKDLKLLLDNMECYISRSYTGEIPVNYENLAPHSLFNGKSEIVSKNRADEILSRLNILTEYQLSSIVRIKELLLDGLRPPRLMKLTIRQVRILQILNQSPNSGIVALSRQLKSTPRTIKRELKTLSNQFGLHIRWKIDPHQFHLNQYGIYFRTKSVPKSHTFEAWIRRNSRDPIFFPFYLGHGLDVNNQEGFLSLYVPNQKRWLQRFQVVLRELSRDFLEVLDVYQILSIYASTNFSYYDYIAQQWRHAIDLQTEGSLRFLEKYGQPLSSPRGFLFTEKHKPFDEIDWILSLILSQGFIRRSEYKDRLSKQGYSLENKTLWAREKTLQKRTAVFPYLTFSQLAFDDTLCFIVECPEHLYPTIFQLATQQAHSRMYTTNQGIIMLLGIPMSGPSVVRQMNQTLIQLPAVKKVVSLRFKHDISEIPDLATASFWDKKNQLWKSKIRDY